MLRELGTSAALSAVLFALQPEPGIPQVQFGDPVPDAAHVLSTQGLAALPDRIKLSGVVLSGRKGPDGKNPPTGTIDPGKLNIVDLKYPETR